MWHKSLFSLNNCISSCKDDKDNFVDIEGGMNPRLVAEIGIFKVIYFLWRRKTWGSPMGGLLTEISSNRFPYKGWLGLVTTTASSIIGLLKGVSTLLIV